MQSSNRRRWHVLTDDEPLRVEQVAVQSSNRRRWYYEIQGQGRGVRVQQCSRLTDDVGTMNFVAKRMARSW